MKQFYFLLAAMLLSLQALAQFPVPGEETPYGHSVDSMLQYVDKSRISSGILYDRVLPLAMLPYFDRFRADTTSVEHLRQAYLELYLCAYNKAGFPFTPSQLRERAEAQVRRNSVPLAVLDYRLHYLDTLAVYHNRLVVRNGLYYDGSNTTGSPYIERLLTLAAPLTRSVPQQASFYIDPTLLLSNRGRVVSSLLVDFGNGASAVFCQPGQTVSISYSTTGPKVLRFTIQFNNGTSAQARARLTVTPQTGIANRGIPRRLPDFEARDAFQDYTGSRSLFGKGEALAVLHNPTSQQEGSNFLLRNPVVIMDGFDPNDETSLNDDTRSVSLLTQLDQSGILGGLERLQRDVIILNFPKSQRRQVSGGSTTEDIDGGTDYVERNAYVLETLLNNLKTRLAPDPATGRPYKFTVIGPSMGGLISRFALAHMEQRQQLLTDAGQLADPWWDHNTAEWISLDVPHLGANIPLADQHLLSFFSNVQAAKDNLEQRLNSVAAKQFLVAHYSYPGIGGASGYRDRFVLALRDNGERNSAGYPVRLRRIALANGQLNGQLNGLLPGSMDGQPGGTMLDLNVYTRFWSGLGAAIISFFGFSYKTTSFTNIATSNIRFLPSSGISATIFSGRTNQTKGLNWGIVGVPSKIGAVRVTGGPQGCWDLAPGGLRDTQRQLHDQFEAAGSGEQYKVSVTDVHPNHCFIPTISALGFQYQNLASYQNTSSLPNPFTNLLGRNLVCTGEIPFDAYYGPTSSNTFHVMPDNNGLLFLGLELSRTVATPTFAVFKAAICPNASATAYSVNPECVASRPGQAQPTTTYIWTLGAGLQLVSGQGTASVQVQPTPGYMGSSNIQVVATRAGYSASAPLNRNIRVGGPDAPQVVQTDPQGICLNNVANFTITNFDPSVSYTVSPVSRVSALPANPTISAFRIKAGGNAPQTGSFNITASACGLSTTAEYYYDFGPCGGPMARQYTIAPNPATNEVQVQEETTNSNQTRSSYPKPGTAEDDGKNLAKSHGIEMVRIYDNYGQLRLEQTYQGVASARLSTSQLPVGLYVMHIISDGTVASRQQFQIVH